MIVSSLHLRNYRNYEALGIELGNGINIFLGRNAQGKTNIIEAVFYAALGRSHRAHADSELIKWDKQDGSFDICFERLGVSNRLKFIFGQEKRRQIILNGQPITLKNLVGTFNAVLFSPEDLFLIKGAPVGRRRFLDGEISQSSPYYYHELMQYNRLISQRNALLKKIRERKVPVESLEPWDLQLANSAANLLEKRLATVKKLNMLSNLMQRRISANEENLTVKYDIYGYKGKEMTNSYASWYNKTLKDRVDLDIMRGSTSIGPHHDDIILTVNGINLRTFGSQGQQRTGILSLKLAELEFLRSETGEYPVLLLDDVMSELDSARREELLRFIRREHIQTFITATDKAYFPQEGFGRYYHVEGGNIKVE